MKTAQGVARWILIVAGLILLGAWLDRPIADRQWRELIEDRANVSAMGYAEPIYEDSMGNVYYVTREERGTGYAMVPRENTERRNP